jgi:hypothetical protein
MHCVLHIGIEKTGTTAIQSALSLNRNVLAEHGICLGWPDGDTNSRFLVSYFRSEPDDYWQVQGWTTRSDCLEDLSETVEWFKNTVKDPHKPKMMILSSEHFHSRLGDEREIAALRDFLFSLFDKVTIVCFLRPQGAAKASMYSTVIRVGQTPSFRKFTRHMREDTDYFDYDRLLSKWRRIFSGSEMVVRPYASANQNGTDIRTEFLKAIELDRLIASLKMPQQRENQALSTVHTALIRCVNMLARGPKWFRISLESRERVVRKIEQASVLEGLPGRRTNSLRFTRQFEEGNSRVSEIYGIPLGFWEEP